MSDNTLPQPVDDRNPERWALIRDALAFQVKLAIDGLRDLVLLPLSALGALLNLCGIRGTPIDFYALVRWGKWSEKKINLFGAARRHRGFRKDSELDALVTKVETLLVEQYQRGGITASAKEVIDRALDGVDRDRTKKTS